jgi:hypothetical protein
MATVKGDLETVRRAHDSRLGLLNGFVPAKNAQKPQPRSVVTICNLVGALSSGSFNWRSVKGFTACRRPRWRHDDKHEWHDKVFI